MAVAIVFLTGVKLIWLFLPAFASTRAVEGELNLTYSPDSFRLKGRVFKFDTSGLGCELPIGLCVINVAIVLPSGDFLDEGLFIGNAAVESWGG